MTGINNYYLIRENIKNKNIEYFDFNYMIFKDKISNGVYIGTIDSMTSLFTDDKEFTNYIDKDNNNNYNNNYNYMILSKKDKNLELNIIWDDKTISSISKLSNSKVDFTINYNYYIFFEIIRNIKDPKTGLAKKVLKARNDSTKINSDNKKIIKLLYETKKEIDPKKLTAMFSDYLEFRALYLNYKENDLEKNNEYKDQLKKLKLKFKED